MDFKRLTIFSGHYGSGKTNVAVNFAETLAKLNKKVNVFDLDIVNPYFRTVDAEKRLASSGIGLVVSPYAETNVDIPAMNAGSYAMVDKTDEYAVVDLGGDDRGALALGRFSDKIKKENDYDLICVVNFFRPETRTAEDALSIMREIERTCDMKFTAIADNTNIGKDTTVCEAFSKTEQLEKLSEISGLPIKFRSVRNEISEQAKEREKKYEILPVGLVEYGKWL